MRGRQQRHPALEAAVFAAALLLAAFIAHELWQRRSALQPAPAATGLQPAVLIPTYPPLPPAPSAQRTVQAVTGAGPMKLARVKSRNPRLAVVPAPK